MLYWYNLAAFLTLQVTTSILFAVAAIYCLITFITLRFIQRAFPPSSNSFKGREAGCQGDAGGDLRASVAHLDS